MKSNHLEINRIYLGMVLEVYFLNIFMQMIIRNDTHQILQMNKAELNLNPIFNRF